MDGGRRRERSDEGGAGEEEECGFGGETIEKSQRRGTVDGKNLIGRLDMTDATNKHWQQAPTLASRVYCTVIQLILEHNLVDLYVQHQQRRCMSC